ncbi:hypothetical protein [Ghiorsea bivora]|uniref:hypothetical protein n=1 Tax=Ghiorsea bivora TaxID=1485545 RepID=UPI00056F7F31|nr:hypothetical protein [Ghiorsea bivora]
MLRTTHILTTGVLLSSTLFATVTTAKPYYPAAAPATYHVGGTLVGVNMISCSTCHSSSPATENNVTTSFGVAFGQRSNDDLAGSLLNAYNSLAPLDSDGDGFSNQQEAFAGSLLNYKTSTPALITPDQTATGITAKAVTGGPVSTLSLQAGTPVIALGGTVDFISPYNSIAPALSTTEFMFKDGGAQADAVITFYDNTGTVIPQLPANSADSGFIANISNGSVNITINDEGVFDLYSTAVFQQEAITKYTNSPISIGGATNVPVTATVDPYAKVSPLAIIEPYAQIDAYAVVDDYAVIGAYAQIGAYAYIGNVDIYTGIDIYTNVIVDTYASVDTYVTVPTRITAKDGTGYVAGKFSVTTTPPTPLILGAAAATGDSGTAGGLHCMTTGLGTQGLMFLGLLGTVFLVRRKLN